MSLDVSKLEKVRQLADGSVQARCPACAEGGSDRHGNHLRIYPDGRFGCCVYPKDCEHRKRIWALAGVHEPKPFTVRVKTQPAMGAARSVKAALSSFGVGTLGTPQTESEAGVTKPSNSAVPDSGTPGTGNSNPRAYAREDLFDTNTYNKDSERPVPAVPDCSHSTTTQISGQPALRLPFLTPSGDLSIPFDSPERYHWWRGGQSVAATLAEVRAKANQGQDF